MEPVCIDSVTFTPETDFVKLASEALLGRVGGSLPQDHSPLAWVFRVYDALAGTPFQDLLAEGLAECLTASQATVRSGALTFFEKYPDAKGHDRILDLAVGDRALFKGISSGSGTNLEDHLMRCIGSLIHTGSQRAAEIGRAEALSPGRPTQLLASLTRADPEWVIEHAEAIVRSTPATGLIILFNLQQIGRDIRALGPRLAPLAKRDRAFLAHLDRFIDDPQVREAIRAALHKRS